MFLLDTNIVIYLQKGLLLESLPVANYSISVITEIELRSYPAITVSQEQWLKRFINDVKVISLTDLIKEQTVLIRFTHTRTTGSMLIVYAPLPSRLNYMPANAASLHLVDVCDNRISTEQTIKLRKERLLKLPDAMVCATAMSERVVLLTNDRQLHEIDGLQCRALELRV